jgi:hypothetical protein
MSKSKTNNAHCSLYGWLKDNNVDLFDVLDEMCAVGLFRPRYPTTFLNPNKELTKKIVKMCDDGKGEDAFKILQSLFIFGKHSKLDGELVSYNRKKYAIDLSKLKKDVTFIQWQSKDNTAVFSYDLDDFPKEGTDSKPPKLERKKRDVEGSNEGSTEKVDYTNKLFKYPDNPDKPDFNLFIKVARNLNSLLKHIESKDLTLFNELSLLMDPNIVVSWFILVQPSSNKSPENPHISDELFESWKPNEILGLGTDTGISVIHEILDKPNNTEKVKEQSIARSTIQKEGFENTKNSIIKSYDGNKQKILEDELRFRFSDNDMFEKSDIDELKGINWGKPEESLVIFSDMFDCLHKPALHTIMIKFVNSNAFKYFLYGNKIHERIKNTIAGAGHGNDNVKKMINIIGSKNRDFINNMPKTNDNKVLSNFVSSLTSKQKSSLMELLKDFD